MKIRDNCKVTLEYTIKNSLGEVVESSRTSGLLSFVQGRNEVPKGLERAVRNAAPGARVQARISPSEGYGHRDPNLVRRAGRSAFRGFAEPYVGLMFRALVDGEERLCRILERDGDFVKYDANHPLAGEVLDFDITVKSVETPAGNGDN